MDASTSTTTAEAVLPVTARVPFGTKDALKQLKPLFRAEQPRTVSSARPSRTAIRRWPSPAAAISRPAAVLGQESKHAPGRDQVAARLPDVRADRLPGPLAHRHENESGPTARAAGPEPNIFISLLVHDEIWRNTAVSGQQLPTDEAELYRAFIRGAVPFRTYSAAVDLVFRIPELRQWMIDAGFVSPYEGRERPTAEIDFKAATERVREAVASGSFESDFPPGASGRAALWLAASLAGVPHLDPLRFFMEALSAEHAKLCAEAVMYAADFMDGTADPSGGLDEETMGPREELFDEICWE